MSVDTYLRGKNTSRYQRQIQDDIQILIAPGLLRIARHVHLDAKRFLLWRAFDIQVEAQPHVHGSSCQHR